MPAVDPYPARYEPYGSPLILGIYTLHLTLITYINGKFHKYGMT